MKTNIENKVILFSIATVLTGGSKKNRRSYFAVRRFVVRLVGKQELPFRRMECVPGQEFLFPESHRPRTGGNRLLDMTLDFRRHDPAQQAILASRTLGSASSLNGSVGRYWEVFGPRSLAG